MISQQVCSSRVRREIGKYVKLKYFQWKIALDIDRFRGIRLADGHDPNMLTFIDRLRILQKYARSNFEISNKKFKKTCLSDKHWWTSIHLICVSLFVCAWMILIGYLYIGRPAGTSKQYLFVLRKVNSHRKWFLCTIYLSEQSGIVWGN